MSQSHEKYTSRLDQLQEELRTETQAYLRKTQEIKADRNLSAEGRQKQLDAGEKAYKTEVSRIEERIQSVTSSWTTAIDKARPKITHDEKALETLKSELDAAGDRSPLDIAIALLMEDRAVAATLTTENGQAELRRALQRAGQGDTDIRSVMGHVSSAAEKRVRQQDGSRDLGADVALLRTYETTLQHAINGVREGLDHGGAVLMASPRSTEKPEEFVFGTE